MNDICSISSKVKLNSEQQLKVSKQHEQERYGRSVPVGHTMSNTKAKIHLISNSFQNFNEQKEISVQIEDQLEDLKEFTE